MICILLGFVKSGVLDWFLDQDLWAFRACVSKPHFLVSFLGPSFEFRHIGASVFFGFSVISKSPRITIAEIKFWWSLFQVTYGLKSWSVCELRSSSFDLKNALDEPILLHPSVFCWLIAGARIWAPFLFAIESFVFRHYRPISSVARTIDVAKFFWNNVFKLLEVSYLRFPMR